MNIKERPTWVWLVAIIVVVFGSMTIKSGGSILFLNGEAKLAAGNFIAKIETTKHNIHSSKNILIKKPSSTSQHRSRAGVVTPRTRHYRDIQIVRAHGTSYAGYGFLFSDNAAYKWLAFTAITVMILDNINEQQQRLHEQAQISATTAEVGKAIIWKDGDASGSVKTTRIGKISSGRHCREFQQSITVGGKSEQVYGTACQQPDGAWEVV